MKTNNGYDINENQCIDKGARQFIFKNQVQWIVVARWIKKSETMRYTCTYTKNCL